jgi:hypothetical protein
LKGCKKLNPSEISKKSIAGGALCSWLKENIEWIEKFKNTKNKPEVTSEQSVNLPSSPSKQRVSTATGIRTSGLMAKAMKSSVLKSPSRMTVNRQSVASKQPEEKKSTVSKRP